jgi:5-methyltetrahydrofolate--homocysteine methyltransferase
MLGLAAAPGGKMLLGTDIQAVLTTLGALKIDVIGLNCSTGPEDMRDAIRYLGEHSPLPSTASPTPACRSRARTARRSSPRSPSRSAAVLGEFVERYDVGIVGGCCGTTPDHIRALAERVEGARPGERPAPGPHEVSSMMTSTPLVQDPTPTWWASG